MEVLFNAPDDDVRIDGKNCDERCTRFAEKNVDSIQELQNALRITRIQAWNMTIKLWSDETSAKFKFGNGCDEWGVGRVGKKPEILKKTDKTWVFSNKPVFSLGFFKAGFFQINQYTIIWNEGIIHY